MARKKQKDKEQEQLDGPGTPDSKPKRLTPVDIQQKEFRLAWRGYNERDVDSFLDELTEEVSRLLAENRRLRDVSQYQSGSGNAGDSLVVEEARSEAARLVEEARQEADRIMAEAPMRADAQAQAVEADIAGATSLSGAGATEDTTPGLPLTATQTALVNAFLTREREFLQELAGMIQGHAEAVKEQVRRAKEATRAPEQEQPPQQQVTAEEEEEERGEPDSPSTSAGAPDAGPPTQAWTPTFAPDTGGHAAPDPVVRLSEEREQDIQSTPAESVPRAASTSGASTDPTGSPPQMSPSRRSAAVSRAEEDEGEDRSLRELFWGED